MGVKMADVSRVARRRHIVQPLRGAQLLGRSRTAASPTRSRCRFRRREWTRSKQIKNIPVADRRRPEPVLLRNVATVTEGTTVGQYERYNMQRMVTVTANIAGRRSRQRRPASRRRARRSSAQPPPGVTVALRGQVVPLQQMLDGLRTGLLMAVVVIFLLLAANFQSLKLSFLRDLDRPGRRLRALSSRSGLTGTTLNIQSFMGAIMAIGVAVANAILLVTFAERSRHGRRDARWTRPWRRAQPFAPHPDDQPRHDRRHDADGSGLGRRRPANRAAGARGRGWTGPRDRGNAVGPSRDLCPGSSPRARRSTSLETDRPNEIRTQNSETETIPKSNFEIPKGSTFKSKGNSTLDLDARPSPGGASFRLRVSDVGLVSDFGFRASDLLRASDFEFRISLAAVLSCALDLCGCRPCPGSNHEALPSRHRCRRSCQAR